jgi:hypothetical protein
MKRVILFFACIIYAGMIHAQPWKDFRYRDGDLLFQDIDCGALCDAIEAVTPALGNKHFSHLGIVQIKHDGVYVIEAIGKNVHLTPLHDFLLRQHDSAGHPKVVVGRLKQAYRQLNGKAVTFALQQTGKPYDDVFAYNNGKYYCSELVYDAYKWANNGKPFFSLHPMTFKDPQTHRTFPAWNDYYKQLGAEIPEGQPGCNPGSIANSTQLEIVAVFY